MLDVDKQPEWECPFKGVIKPNAELSSLRPRYAEQDEQFDKEWVEWCKSLFPADEMQLGEH